MVKLKSKGQYRITFNGVEYDLKPNMSYEIDEKTAKQFVENGYCKYAKIKNETQGIKTHKGKK